MSNRVEPSELKLIIDTDYDNFVLTNFITTANLVVSDVLGDSGLSDSLLAEIEKYLAAHFLASTLERRRQISREQALDASATYDGRTGLGLDFTSYGQMVKILDTSGKLSSVVGKKAAKIYAVPEDYS